MILLRLALASLRARRLTALLTVLTVALSVALFQSVETVRKSARSSFADTISDTDLIIGARSGGVQLLLYSVFRIGNATNNVTWQSYEEIAARPEVDWSVPISLGDSHRQFRVMGTTEAFFERYKYRGGRSLEFSQGAGFSDLFDAVIGADVARDLGYTPGQSIVVAHGIQSFTEHDDLPFRVSGILARTGTPVDRTVIVSLRAIEAIHVDWQSGARRPGAGTPAEVLREMPLKPQAITAALVGVRSPLQIFRLQRHVNEYRAEPLLAVLPGVALQELWALVGVAETALVAVSGLVVLTALLGMTAMILSGLEARRREMAILRAQGARPGTITALLVLEAMLMALAGAALGLALSQLGLWALRPVIDARFGLWLSLPVPGLREVAVMAAVTGAGALAALLPALRAYRISLADGMAVRH